MLNVHDVHRKRNDIHSYNRPQISIDSCEMNMQLLVNLVKGTIDIYISGYASQCSGISKITTEAECKLAAEYNSKNNIDKNRGYGGRWSESNATTWMFL